jgi:hypothetical protein
MIYYLCPQDTMSSCTYQVLHSLTLSTTSYLVSLPPRRRCCRPRKHWVKRIPNQTIGQLPAVCGILLFMERFNHLGTWLPDKIRASGLTVQEFADKSNVSRSALYHFMKDTRRPDEESIQSICKTLGIPAEEGREQYTPKTTGRPKGNERVQQTAGVVG